VLKEAGLGFWSASRTFSELHEGKYFAAAAEKTGQKVEKGKQAGGWPPLLTALQDIGAGAEAAVAALGAAVSALFTSMFPGCELNVP
jgi:ribosomal protein S11